jgi:hypothetical protein
MKMVITKAPPISLTCGSVTLTWIDAEVSVDRLYSLRPLLPTDEDFCVPDYQEWEFPSKPDEWPAMEVEIAKGGVIALELETRSSGRKSFAVDKVRMTSTGIVVGQSRPESKLKA